MKTVLISLSIALLACGSTLDRPTDTASFHPSYDQTMESSFYDFKMKDINGQEIDFASFKGKKLLLVNVASKCGYTKQYEGLQKLYETYNKKLVVVGFPCNQFLGQEPGTSEEIMTFCKTNYGVTFPLAEKIDVKGKDAAPIYKWLCSKEANGVLDTKISWNFNKFLLDENGKMIAYFPSNVKPDSEDILSRLK